MRPGECRIVSPAGQAHIRPMLMDLLTLLAGRAGQVVSKDEILDRLREIAGPAVESKAAEAFVHGMQGAMWVGAALTLVAAMVEAVPALHCLRDLTRGGLTMKDVELPAEAQVEQQAVAN